MPTFISDSGATHPWSSPLEDISVQSRLEKRPKTLLIYGRKVGLRFLLGCGLCLFASAAHSQTAQEEPLPGPDNHETGQGPHGHLFGEWGGERTRLEERGVNFDFQYVSDSLWNLKSVQKERFASWNRFRWTVDIDFGKLTGQHNLYFHATALWQGGWQSRNIPRTSDQSQRDVQREHMPSRFMVDRKAMAE